MVTRSQEVDAVGLKTFAVYSGKGTVKFMTKQCEAMMPYQVCATKCILPAGHPLPHRAATNATWDGDGPCTARIGSDEPCMLATGHDGPHVGFYGSRWGEIERYEKVGAIKVTYCHSRHHGDEPCILGNGHIGEHFGANGTYWDEPTKDAQSYRSTEAFTLAEALRRVLREVACTPNQPPMRQNKAFDRALTVLEAFDGRELSK